MNELICFEKKFPLLAKFLFSTLEFYNSLIIEYINGDADRLVKKNQLKSQEEVRMLLVYISSAKQLIDNIMQWEKERTFDYKFTAPTNWIDAAKEVLKERITLCKQRENFLLSNCLDRRQIVVNSQTLVTYSIVTSNISMMSRYTEKF